LLAFLLDARSPQKGDFRVAFLRLKQNFDRCCTHPDRGDHSANFLPKRWHVVRPDSVLEVSNKVSPAICKTRNQLLDLQPR
jgi:hypothetical protein